MIRLSQFIIERQTGEVLTKEQELLSCVFFDAYFNRGNKFKGPEDIVEYYNSIRDNIIANIVNIAHADMSKFDKIIQPDLSRRIPKYTDWSKSYVYQCLSFEKWIKKHKSFDTVMAFVHHDTSVGICNGVITTDWSIDNRVDNGKRRYRINNKDDYQKADIYAVVQDPNAMPEEDIMDEVEYWIQALEGNVSERFVGISLKKLGGVLSKVHTYGIDVIAFKAENITMKVPIFQGVIYKGDMLTAKAGLLSSKISFTDDGDRYSIDIRSSGKDPEKYAGADIITKSSGKTNNAYACFGHGATIQLTASKKLAQLGRAETTLNKWYDEYNISKKNKNVADISEYKMMIDYINKAAASLDIGFEPIVMDNESEQAIEFLIDNAADIRQLLVMYQRSGHKLTQEIIDFAETMGIFLGKLNYADTFINIFSMVKWQMVVYTTLCACYAILRKMQEIGAEKALEILFMGAKGISQGSDDIRLPYVMVG